MNLKTPRLQLHNRFFLRLMLLSIFALLPTWLNAEADELALTYRQLTSSNSHHHFFGYIGHVQTIPWNESGRYMLALRTTFHDHMPEPEEAADVVLLDTANDYQAIPVDKTHAYNFQQGTMFYWNPDDPENQFFFNDRNLETGKVFTVLYDVSQRKRVREYRFDDTPIGNSGVAQNGGYFAAFNYGRTDRLRPVTGYPGAYDWTVGVNHPKDDGVFKVDIQTGDKTLLVSFKQLADALRPSRPTVDDIALFINHTLWNREDDLLYFYARGNFEEPRDQHIDRPFIVRPDGTGLKPLGVSVGGHPEWDYGHRIIGTIRNERQVLYDVDRMLVVGALGNKEIFPNPGADIALSPDGKWFVNGYQNREDGHNYYTLYRREDGAYLKTRGFSRGGYDRRELRIDPAPRWNRTSDAIVVPSWTKDGTRQMFLISIKRP